MMFKEALNWYKEVKVLSNAYDDNERVEQLESLVKIIGLQITFGATGATGVFAAASFVLVCVNEVLLGLLGSAGFVADAGLVFLLAFPGTILVLPCKLTCSSEILLQNELARDFLSYPCI